ncbi:uncharacterized protein VP01_571g8 [Puccinia sorghi]|uniref:Uncharacterized protein n=1 Tax=Puccinia sorghi TaxID=27349 RepID=A0A0L6UJC8_9BASI|nr:uncharacterized protein VP01_571g8 [Puccinia sorghi]
MILRSSGEFGAEFQLQHNSLQLKKSIRFLEIGVPENVNKYLNYIGLTSSRSTALASLRTLSKYHKKSIWDAMAQIFGLPLAPTIFIENIDVSFLLYRDKQP